MKLFYTIIIATAAFLFFLSETLIPESLRITLASVAGCNITQEQLNKEEQFYDSELFWVIPYSYMQRGRYSVFPPKAVVNDGIVEEITSLHILLTTSSAFEGKCDEQILSMFHSFAKSNFNINHESLLGLTALHEAVILKKVEFAEVLVSSGASLEIKNNFEGVINGMTAKEMAEFFYSKRKSDELSKIISILDKKT